MGSQVEKYIPEYLIIGHISKDLTQDGSRPGGTALYSGILAHRMGLKVALITSCEELPNLEDLNDIHVINFPAIRSTTFRNIYTEYGREQYITDKADNLEISLIPGDWLRSKILHLGPLVGEIDLPDDLSLFYKGSTAYSLQGWLRDWDEKGAVYPVEVEGDLFPVDKHSAGFLSLEDLGNDHSQLEYIRNNFPLLVLTKGKDGAEIYHGEKIISIPAEQVVEIDPTGAGDIFAAGFMIYWVLRGRSVQEAGIIANRLAAISVTRPGLEGIPTVAEIHKIEQN
jgi:hypothetical protein